MLINNLSIHTKKTSSWGFLFLSTSIYTNYSTYTYSSSYALTVTILLPCHSYREKLWVRRISSLSFFCVVIISNLLILFVNFTSSSLSFSCSKKYPIVLAVVTTYAYPHTESMRIKNTTLNLIKLTIFFWRLSECLLLKYSFALQCNITSLFMNTWEIKWDICISIALSNSFYDPVFGTSCCFIFFNF